LSQILNSGKGTKIELIQNADLSALCTYGVGGRAKRLVFARCTDGLNQALGLDDNWIVIGNASKLLFLDSGFDGTIIATKDDKYFFKTQKDDKSDFEFVYAGAGVKLPLLARQMCKAGLYGLEWAGGIPALIGGAVKMNAGAHGGDMATVVKSVDVFKNGKKIVLTNCRCGFGYRQSGFERSDIILGATLQLKRASQNQSDKMVIEKTKSPLELLNFYNKKRALAQPKGKSCGSVFKAVTLNKSDLNHSVANLLKLDDLKPKRLSGQNDIKAFNGQSAEPTIQIPAWKFIDACNLKGTQIGGAIVSKIHANFIINSGNAKSDDIISLINLVKSQVYDKFSIKLLQEVIIVD